MSFFYDILTLNFEGNDQAKRPDQHELKFMPRRTIRPGSAQ